VSPLLVGVLVRNFGWMIVLSFSGPLNQILLSLGLIHQPMRLLFNLPVVVLALVHVFVPFMPIVPEQYINTGTWEQIDNQARRWNQQRLRKLTQKAKKTGVRIVGLLLEGDPARQIARAARSKHADLLVVGTHGRTGLAKFFVGSVAGRLVATASCPVVTVRSR